LCAVCSDCGPPLATNILRFRCSDTCACPSDKTTDEEVIFHPCSPIQPSYAFYLRRTFSLWSTLYDQHRYASELAGIKTADSGDDMRFLKRDGGCVEYHTTSALRRAQPSTSSTARPSNASPCWRIAWWSKIHVDTQGQFATTLRNTRKGDNIRLRSSLIENDGKTLI
jgi:hypothetical protein